MGNIRQRSGSTKMVLLALAMGSICACSSTKAAPDQAAGAGTTVQAAPAARIADPCKLLTQAEASEAIAAQVDAGELKQFGVITRCSFYNKRDSQQELLLDVQNDKAPVADSVLFDSSSHGPDAKPVPGIGDQALWFHSEGFGGGTSLDILKGGRLVHIILPRTIKTMTPAVLNAARLIAGRM